jgi:uncharacterized protein
VSIASGPKEVALRLAFRLYKSTLSPLFHSIAPSRCLYLPTCSEYAYTAVSRFGIVRGSWMALRRFARCHPWGKGGLDPVPDCAGHREQQSAASVSNQKDADHLP